MKRLLIEEMKRAIQIMEAKEEVVTHRKVEGIGYKDQPYTYYEIDREVTELKHLLKAIRKHSILLEKEIK